jgi:pyruvyl transferase EpsO
MSTDASLIEALSAAARRALEPHTPEQPYALLDFPGHPNVGDSAIWAGEMAYLRRYGRTSPAYVASLRNFDLDDLRQRCPTGPIYIHGGGNFGDVWPHHQAFRNRLLEETRGQPLIQFPQSIHFASPQQRDEAARLIERHGRFTLFVRDHESLDLAKRHFQCDTILCPDMAFFIGPMARPRAPELDVLCLLRTDAETSAPGGQAGGDPGLRVTDWLGEPRTRLRAAKAWGALRAALLQGPRAFRSGAFNSAAEARVRRGSDLLASGRAVVTDRLHTHILCLLLGIPHAVLDNNYGKVGRFISCWTSTSTLTHRSASMQSALDWAKGQAAAA